MPFFMQILRERSSFSWAVLVCFFPVLCFSCVTENVPPPPMVFKAGKGGRIYPPPVFYGRWRSGGDEIVFQLPPRIAALVRRGPGAGLVPHDLAGIRRNQNGTHTFLFQPALGHTGLVFRKTFRLLGENSLRELTERGKGPLWKRVHSR